MKKRAQDCNFVNYTVVLNFLYSLLTHTSFSSCAYQVKNEIVGVVDRLNIEINTNKVSTSRSKSAKVQTFFMQNSSEILITFLLTLYSPYLACKELKIPNKA